MKTSLGGLLAVMLASILIGGCGGSDGDSGTPTIGVADAKPSLPVSVKNVYVSFDEVSIHKAGGGWESLPSEESEIDLYRFSDGDSTHLVPPLEIDSGKYTQIRLVLAETGQEPGNYKNYIVTTEDEEIPLTVPSGFLRTDKNFDFEVEGGGAVDLTVHFDLSQSIVDQGGGEYQLKPVLHLQETQAAAKIQGSIAAASFGESTEAVVTVYSEGVEYTSVVVQKPEATDPVPFTIFWLVPNQSYHVEVAVEGFAPYEQDVGAEDLGPGGTFSLNGDEPITL
jgi:hypothetical protein